MFSRKRARGTSARRRRRRRPTALAQSLVGRRRTPAPEHGPYDVADAPDGRARGSTWAACRSRPSTGSRCGCRPTRTAQIQQVVLVSRRQRAAARRVRRAAHRGHLGRGPRRDAASDWSPTASPPQEVDGEYGAELRGPGAGPAGRPGRPAVRRRRRAALDGPGGVPGPGGDRSRTRRRLARRVPARASWWTATTRPGRSASRCRCGCRRRWPSRRRRDRRGERPGP